MTSHGRLTAFGNQLIDVHRWLREEFAMLRDDVDASLAGGAGLRELRTHCLTFRSALNRHHHGADAPAFTAVAEQFPELRTILEVSGLNALEAPGWDRSPPAFLHGEAAED
ncbi:hypothetical protein [Streptomyces ficellus]|uniref:hypothetical protein n=1 Tax=Streptomyces ficellus TaxID=1977088 RepID=UPI001AD756A7|nr:hypothetical protein [Streptomyces ficellus]